MNIFEYLLFPLKTSFKDWTNLFIKDKDYITQGLWFHLNTTWNWSYTDDIGDFIIKNRGKFATRKVIPRRPFIK